MTSNDITITVPVHIPTEVLSEYGSPSTDLVHIYKGLNLLTVDNLSFCVYLFSDVYGNEEHRKMDVKGQRHYQKKLMECKII